MEIWQTILLAVGGQSILLAVLGFLGKSFLDKIIVRDTAVFQDNLNAKTNLAIENLRSTLQIREIEHKERFSRFHEKRAEVIANIYHLLVETLWEVETFISPMQWAGDLDKKDQYGIANNKFVELYRFFDKNRIYLPESLCESLHGFFVEVRGHLSSMGVWVRHDDESLPDHARQQKEAASDKSWNAIKSEIPATRKLLESEFRSLLGASDA